MAINQLFGSIWGLPQEQQLYFEQIRRQALSNLPIQNPMTYQQQMALSPPPPPQLCDVTEERKLLLTGEIE